MRRRPFPSRRAEDAIDEFIYGYHPVREALRHRPHLVREILVAARKGKRRSEIEALSQHRRVALKPVAPERLGDLAAGQVHNGFGAFIRRAPEPRARTGDPDLQVLVEDVQDPRNLGALLRVCEAAGVGQLMVRDRGSAPFSSAVRKTSAGAAEWLPMKRITNTAREIERLKAEGFWIYGADASGSPPWEQELAGKVLLCIGGEERGLRARTRKMCDWLVGLPMLGRVESLNLSTASAALLYEAVRQRSNS